ncbi:MAG TPA: glycoside hydrolase family 3 C-terminal domain-containing protein [Jatrophihabitans sp.]|nr:glycoside hydrolase family 3 C-terminal domain-containing protein [Jatrophihabitans sp.]
MTRPLDTVALLTELTLAEKAALCTGADFWNSSEVRRDDTVLVPAVMLTDGPHGVRKQAEDADHVDLEGSVPATCFPTAAALGSSWDPELVERVGVALGEEARAERVGVLLGPGVNIKRSPLCGRNFEYFSEDPLISGVLGAALIRGIQSQGVAGSVKHFAVNNQETDRMRVSAEVDPRALREIYLPAFERIITEADPWTVMCSYNRINGVYASEHHWLLSELLRDEWGYAGLVMSDWGAVRDRVASLAAGLDLQMPGGGSRPVDAVIEAVESGRLDPAVLDRSVGRLLELLNRVLPAVTQGGDYDVAAHHRLAREVAADCAVLLKNDGALLPLDPDSAGSIAVIGELARTPRYQGAGSSLVSPTRLDTALAEIERTVGASNTVTFVAGYPIDETGDAEALLAEAVVAAQGADTVLLFVGLPPIAEAEGFDRSHIDLPADQLALIDAVAAYNDRVVVVLSNGSAVAVDAWQHQVPAVLEGWLLGQAGGGAIADLLFGLAVPSGRLTETIPRRLADTPSYLNFPGEQGSVRYGESLFVGYRYYDAKQLSVSYPFGHGLSYTSFSYRDLRTVVSGSGDELAVDVTVTVSNTGQWNGKEVVQVYVGQPGSYLQRPPRELKGFAKVALAAGESTDVMIRLTARDFSYFHPGKNRWVLEAGGFTIAVGASSRDLRLQADLTLDGEFVGPELTADAPFEAWLADPVGGPLLLAAISKDGVVPDLEADRMMLPTPLRVIASFPGSPITLEDVDALVEAAAKS